MIQKLKVIVCTMICCMVGVVSIAVAQEKMPDLLPVVVNANQGTIEIRNIGKAKAKPSRVVIVCSRFDSTTPSTPCAVGLHLPAYTKKWNMLSYDVPTLRPGASYALHLFAPDALPRKAGNYAMKITVDLGKRIAEANESNNYTRLDTVIRTKILSTSGKLLNHESVASRSEGLLQLTVLMDGKPVKAAIVVTRPRQRTLLIMSPAERKRQMKQTPFEVSLLAGRYDLSVHAEPVSPLKIYMHLKALPIVIKKGKRLEKTVTIPSGRMQLSTSIEGKKTTGIKVDISGLYNNFKYFSARGVLKTPVDISIPAGKYRLKAWSAEAKQYQTSNVDIKAGSTVKYALNFDKLRTGYLKLSLLMDGKPIPYEISRYSNKKGFLYDVSLVFSDSGAPAVLYSPSNIQPVKLRVGVYDIKIHEDAVAGKDILIKRVTIHEGETVEKMLEIIQPGELNIVASWTDQPFNLLACAAYHNPINLNRLGALMGGGTGAGARSRGDCFSPEVSLEASISSSGRSDGNIAKSVFPKWKTNKDADGNLIDGDNIASIKFNTGIYDVMVWPVGHPELKQSVKGIEIKPGIVLQKKLKFHWPGKKK